MLAISYNDLIHTTRLGYSHLLAKAPRMLVNTLHSPAVPHGQDECSDIESTFKLDDPDAYRVPVARYNIPHSGLIALLEGYTVTDLSAIHAFGGDQRDSISCLRSIWTPPTSLDCRGTPLRAPVASYSHRGAYRGSDGRLGRAGVPQRRKPREPSFRALLHLHVSSLRVWCAGRGHRAP